jgi:hypothetical protein
MTVRRIQQIKADISALTGLWQMSEFTKISQLAGNGWMISGQ